MPHATLAEPVLVAREDKLAKLMAQATTQGSEHIACFQNGQWILVPPRLGMRVTDLSANCERRYDGGWLLPVTVADPTGGTVIDTQARAAIAALIAALVEAGTIRAA